MINKYIIVLIGLISSFSLTACSPTKKEPPKTAPPEHHIAIRQANGKAEFYDSRSNKKFIPRGVNYVYIPRSGKITVNLFKVGEYDPELTRKDFKVLASWGYNTVRVFLDHCSEGIGCIGDSDNIGLNPAYLANIADLLLAAKESELYILFTSNDLPDQGGYAEEANSQIGPHFAGYRNSYYLTSGAVKATRRYWRDLLTGLAKLNANTEMVLGWQLVNEQWLFEKQPPLSLTSGMVTSTTGTYDMSDDKAKQLMVSEGLIHYIAEVKAEILKYDPTALVTMGFFPPGIPDRYVETVSLLSGSNLDFFDFHSYTDKFGPESHADKFGMKGFDAKPIVMGEYGAFRFRHDTITYAAQQTINWQAESCKYGYDGWVYWSYYPAAASAGDQTWGFTDNSGYLGDILSPNKHTDICKKVTIP